jgi:hypothetical protein
MPIDWWSSAAFEKLEDDGSRKPVSTDSVPLLTYVNFARTRHDRQHGSADYPALCWPITRDQVTMFANACGNINHINEVGRHRAARGCQTGHDPGRRRPQDLRRHKTSW